MTLGWYLVRDTVHVFILPLALVRIINESTSKVIQSSQSKIISLKYLFTFQCEYIAQRFSSAITLHPYIVPLYRPPIQSHPLRLTPSVVTRFQTLFSLTDRLFLHSNTHKSLSNAHNPHMTPVVHVKSSKVFPVFRDAVFFVLKRLHHFVPRSHRCLPSRGLGTLTTKE